MMIILYILLGIVALFLLTAALTSRDYACSRSIVIQKSKQEVFDFVKFLRNQDLYSKWASMDPHMKKEFRGEDAKPGAVSSWDGNKDVGKGEQEIKHIREAERIDYELRFEKPWKSVAQSYLQLDAEQGATRVTWGITGTSKYPLNIMNLMMNNLLGKDLTIGLSNLKRVMEER